MFSGLYNWFHSLNIDQLQKFNSSSQIALAVFGVLTAIALIFTALTYNRIIFLEKEYRVSSEKEKSELQNRVEIAEQTSQKNLAELEKEKKSKEPRNIPEDHIIWLKSRIIKKPNGKIKLFTINDDKEAYNLSFNLKKYLRT